MQQPAPPKQPTSEVKPGIKAEATTTPVVLQPPVPTQPAQAPFQVSQPAQVSKPAAAKNKGGGPE